MRKHGIDLEDGDGSQTKRLNRKDLDALMGGDGRSGIFTWREKNRRKVRMIVVGCSPDLLISAVPCTCQLAYSV
jgi:protein-serine/threonine kinase